jgi:hypothetical protein
MFGMEGFGPLPPRAAHQRVALAQWCTTLSVNAAFCSVDIPTQVFAKTCGNGTEQHGRNSPLGQPTLQVEATLRCLLTEIEIDLSYMVDIKDLAAHSLQTRWSGIHRTIHGQDGQLGQSETVTHTEWHTTSCDMKQCFMVAITSRTKMTPGNGMDLHGLQQEQLDLRDMSLE